MAFSWKCCTPCHCALCHFQPLNLGVSVYLTYWRTSISWKTNETDTCKKKSIYHQCNKWSIANRHSDFCFISTVTLPLCPYCQATLRECRQEWRTFIPLSLQRVHSRTHLLIFENLDLGIFIFGVALQYLMRFRWSTSEHFVIFPILC